MEQHEYIMKMQMLGQEAEKIEQQIQVFDQQITELTSVKESIAAIKDGEQKEILSNLGKGIFLKTQIRDTELLVNVGKEVVVNKTAEETIEVIDNQTMKLMQGKESLIQRISELQASMQQLLMQAQSDENFKPGAKAHSHEHSHSCSHEDCECEEPCEDCECERSSKKTKKK
jgi:prefoldin alpha subunit